jgi:hypothetical protein
MRGLTGLAARKQEKRTRSDRARTTRRSLHAFRPDVEACESRLSLSGMHAAAMQQAPSAQASTISPALAQALSHYTVFGGVITHGLKKGLTIAAPIVVGPTDSRGQVIAELFPPGQHPLFAVGLVFGNRVSLRLTLANGTALEVQGVGHLVRVPGGLPGGFALVGSGILSGPGNQFLSTGVWLTVRPALATAP